MRSRCRIPSGWAWATRQHAAFVAVLMIVPAPMLACQFDQVVVSKSPSGNSFYRSEESGVSTVDKAQFLSQGGVVLTSATPKVAIQAVKYYVAFSEHSMTPFYLAVNLPTVSDTTLRRIAESLEDEYGGLVAASFGNYRRVKAGKFLDFKDSQLGLHLDYRLGARVDDLGGGGASLRDLAGLGFSSLLLKLVLPVFRDVESRTRAGTLSVGISALGLLSLKGEVQPRGASHKLGSLGYVNLNASLYITDLISVQVGKTLGNSSRDLPNRWFVGASLIPLPRTSAAPAQPQSPNDSPLSPN
jgi:hypothetical protein